MFRKVLKVSMNINALIIISNAGVMNKLVLKRSHASLTKASKCLISL